MQAYAPCSPVQLGGMHLYVFILIYIDLHDLYSFMCICVHVYRFMWIYIYLYRFVLIHIDSFSLFDVWIIFV